MKISRLTLSAALAAAACGALVAPGAMAADGTITFSGKIIGQTCEVTTGTNGSFSVTLPVVQTSDFAAAGDTAGAKDFQIDLDNCPKSPTVSVAASFSAGNINSSGRLSNTGSASGVDIALYDQGSSTAINITDDSAADGSWATIDSTTGDASLKYTAKYYATGAVTAGDVASTVDYTLVYQ